MKRLALVLVLLGLADSVAAQQPRPARDAGSAWLGVAYDLRWIQTDSGCAARVVLEGVIPGSPAERAGLRAGDALIAVDGDRAPARRLPLLSARLAPGDSVRLLVERDGSSRTLTAIADRRPDGPPALAPVPSPALAGGPVIHVLGDSLVASKIAAAPGPVGPQGYWLTHGDGRTVFRSLPAQPRSDLDRRVAALVGCAREYAQTLQPAPGGEMMRLHERADSLRVVIARRVLEAQDEQRRAIVMRSVPPGLDGVPQPAGVFMFRSAGGAAFQNLAGADLVVMEPELAEYFRGVRAGLLVLRVVPGTVAERSGLRPGDVLTAAGGRSLTGADDLVALDTGPGRPLELSVVRQGRTRTITVRQP